MTQYPRTAAIRQRQWKKRRTTRKICPRRKPIGPNKPPRQHRRPKSRTSRKLIDPNRPPRHQRPKSRTSRKHCPRRKLIGRNNPRQHQRRTRPMRKYPRVTLTLTRPRHLGPKNETLRTIVARKTDRYFR